MPDLEPRTRTGPTADTVQARLHDPLWLLARQWQFGEFRAGNGGAPVRTEITPEPFALSRLCAGVPAAAAAVGYDPAKVPLETAVEREALPARGLREPGSAVEAGLHFLRLLEASGGGAHAGAYRAKYALSRAAAEGLRASDPGGAVTLEPMAGRLPDANALYADLSAAFGPDGEKAGGALPAQPAIPAADAPKVTAAVKAWLRWYRGQGASVPADGAATPWIADRMEYRFSVAGSGASTGEVVLSAPEYVGGRLDWTSFVTSPGASLGAPRPAAGAKDTRTVIPMPVSFRGMPAPRLWAFEDGGVNLGALDPGGTAHQLLLEFALVYGDDWFVVPLELDVGSLCRIAELRVIDSFGEATLIRHSGAVDAPSSSWRMFTASRDPLASAAGASPGADLLFLAPALGPMLTGAPLEDVLLIRDEMANLAWAIERTVTGLAGTRIERSEAWRSRMADAAPEPAVGGAARYRLGTSVPDHWLPLTLDDTSIYLKRGTLPGGGTGATDPRGRLLSGMVRLFEEEVPREGAHVTRAFQHTRWTDGSSHLWLGRRKNPGRGEGSSGLRFDAVEPWQAPASRRWGYEELELGAYTGPDRETPRNLEALAAGEAAYLVWRVRNTGAETWRRSGPNPVRLGTSDPRDHPGLFLAPSWPLPIRAAELREEVVAPGAVGTFAFEVRAPYALGPRQERFDLVAESKAWFDGARLTVRATVVPPPPPIIDAPADNSYDRDGAFAVSGTAEAASTVRLYEGTKEIGSVKAGGDGRFSIALSGVPEGRHTYTAKATDAGGNSSAASAPRTVTVDWTPPPPPTITAPPSNSHSPEGAFTVRGTAEPMTTVRLFEGPTVMGTAQTAPDGTWNIALTGVPPGRHDYAVTATDPAGNASRPSAIHTIVVGRPPVTVTAVTPAVNARGVPLAANVTATFSEPMRPGSINANTIVLVRRGTTAKVPASVRYDAPTRRAILDPAQPLRRGATYVATVTTGARDQAGNPLAAALRWAFTVRR